MKNKANKSIRVEECFDGDFSRRADCQEWMSRFKSYVKTRLNNFEVRVDAYYHNGNLYLTVDSYNFATKDSIAVSIVINRKCIDLGDPEDDQQDIALPGLADGLYFIKSLLNVEKKQDEPTAPINSQQGLWVSLADKQGVW